METRYYERDYERGERDYERGRYAPHPSNRANRDIGWGEGRDDGRGLVDRAGDEVRAWFGDEEARRRRRMDERWDEQQSREGRYARARSDTDEVRAGDVMTRNVVTIHPNDTVERAARLMGECDCGALPVTDGNGRLVGMVTDRDIAVRIAGRGIDSRRARVGDCMTNETFACHANDSIEDCMHEMARHQVRRIPIVYDNNRLAGIVSQADLARHAGSYQGRGERRAMADMLSAVSEPSREPYR